jgi:hypothetical protein
MDAAIDKLAKLRDRASTCFGAMRLKSGETPSQSLSQLDERLAAADEGERAGLNRARGRRSKASAIRHGRVG